MGLKAKPIKISKYLLGQYVDGSEVDFAKFHFRAFSLDCDLSFLSCTIVSVIDQVAINPDLDLVIKNFDVHLVPLTRLISQMSSLNALKWKRENIL